MINHCSFLCLLRSSRALIWLRVSFFFLTTGPAAAPPSASLPAGVAVADPAGVCNLDPAGVCNLDRAGVFVPLPLGVFPSANASSTTAALPLCVILPASMCQISGPLQTRGFNEYRARKYACSGKLRTQSANKLLVVRDDNLHRAFKQRKFRVHHSNLRQHQPNHVWQQQAHPTPPDPRNYSARRECKSLRQLMTPVNQTVKDPYLRVIP